MNRPDRACHCTTGTRNPGAARASEMSLRFQRGDVSATHSPDRRQHRLRSQVCGSPHLHRVRSMIDGSTLTPTASVILELGQARRGRRPRKTVPHLRSPARIGRFNSREKAGIRMGYSGWQPISLDALRIVNPVSLDQVASKMVEAVSIAAFGHRLESTPVVRRSHERLPPIVPPFRPCWKPFPLNAGGLPGLAGTRAGRTRRQSARVTCSARLQPDQLST